MLQCCIAGINYEGFVFLPPTSHLNYNLKLQFEATAIVKELEENNN